MPIQGLKFNIPTGLERHLSFQATGSFTAYNPNDGYTLIALDRTATLLDYDHKLPSQSGGHFPGPINSYLSMYFVDQSGAGLTGQVIVYASPDTLQIPQFWSIGRAIQSQVTSVDLIQGVLPPAPPANTTRLWSDASGHLHLEQSTGTDFTVLDNTNYNALITLTGDVIGPLSNSLVQYRNATTVSARDSGGTLRNHLTFGGETLWWAGVGGGFRWVNAGNSVQWMALDASGNLAVTGTLSSASHTVTGFVTATTYISAGPAISGSPGDLNANRNNGSGYVFLANASHYVGFDGTYYQMPTSTLVVGGGVYVGGGINTGITTSQLIITGSTGTWILDHGSGIVSYVSGNYVNASSRAIIEQPGSPWGGYGQFWSGPILINGGGGSATISLNNINGGSAYLSAVGCYAVVGGSNNNGQSFYCAGGSGGPTGWQIISTERYKSSLVVIDNALKIVLDPTLHGMHYTKTISAKLTGGEDAVDSEPFEEYGFIAEPWSQVAPDVVGYHEGVVHMMDYGQVNAILFEAFKQYVAQTDARLDRLEANA